MQKLLVSTPRAFGAIFFSVIAFLLIPFLLSTKVFAASPIVNASGSGAGWYNTQLTAIVYTEATDFPIAETRYSWTTNDMNAACDTGGTVTDNAEVLNAPIGGTTLYLCSRDTDISVGTWSGEYNWEITPPSAPAIMSLFSPIWQGDHFISGTFITNAPSGSTDTGGSGLSTYSFSRCDDVALTQNCTVIASGITDNTVTVSGANLPSEGGAMYYYWTATDNALNVSDPSTPEFVQMDTTGPEGTIMNESGDPTTTIYPTLSMIYYDAGVGITGAQMELSCDAINWSPLEPFAGVKSDFNIKPSVETYGCATTDGPRIIFVRFYDALGNSSATDNTGVFALAEDIPTPTPTVTPTDNTPTPTPTDTPTPTPTEIPSITPTDNVTPTPSEIPSITPTDNVTPTPSEIPSITPTDNVTVTPSQTLTPTITTTDNVSPTPIVVTLTPVVSSLPATGFIGDNIDKVILGLLFMGLGLYMYYSGNYLVIGNLVWDKGGKNFYKGGKNFYSGFGSLLEKIVDVFDKANINFKVFLNNIKLSFIKAKDHLNVLTLEIYSKFSTIIKNIFTHTKKNVKKTIGSVGLSKKEKFENDLLDEE